MTLQKRLVFFILVPVALLLVAMGGAGLIYAKNSLLNQWAEASTLKLQRAAHFVDMKLSHTKGLLKMFQLIGNAPQADRVRGFILQQLKAAEGVTRVAVISSVAVSGEMGPEKFSHGTMSQHRQMMTGDPAGMPFHHANFMGVTPPRYDPSTDDQTVSIVSDLKDADDRTVGQIEVHLRFDSLVGAIESTGWWSSHKAFIIDRDGNILASNLSRNPKEFAGREDPLEKSTLAEMETMPFGTIFGKGFPPKEISGFYKLQEAPWTLVIIAPGDEVLAPILRFQALYLVTGVVFIVLILILIRFVAGSVVASIREVSQAADSVAKGHYGIQLPVKSRDEVGDLFQSFNRMVVQLEERARIKTSLNLAMEIQQSLLPQKSIRFDFLDIAGQSLYCDEIGGDYYDFLQVPAWGPNRIGVAVGDVTGHGVPSALLMATARALINSCAEQQKNLADILTDVNRLLCRDTSSSGNFMTLFFMRFDGARKEIRWVRAGQDPAIVYNPVDDAFTDLVGEGMALGVDPTYRFTENVYSSWAEGQIAAIVTDGVWEAEGEGGERFGKERLRQAVRRHHDKSASKILAAVADEVAAFRKGRKAEDDVTLVIVKALGAGAGKGGNK